MSAPALHHTVDVDPEQGGLDLVLPSPPPASYPTLSRAASSIFAATTVASSAVTLVGMPSPKPSSSPLAKEIGSEKPAASVTAATPPMTTEKAPAAAKTPAKRARASRWVRFWLWFNAYRRFFTFVVTLNAIGILLAALGKWPYAITHFGALVLGNLLTAILMRNEVFGRALYWIVNKSFAKWTPLWWRLGCTSVLQHLGGIHSGCATSGMAWLVYKIVYIFINRDIEHDAVLIMGVVTNLCVIVSILSAFPWVRNTYHNVFERYHRFIGWLGLAATWVFVVLDDTYDAATHSWDPSGAVLLHAQEFWFIIGMTIFIVLPWFFVRSVEVDTEIPSPKVAVLRFKRGMQHGLLGRISRTSLLEYHAFGTISEGPEAKYHYMICGVQGDFTRGLVTDPPTRIWTRELKFAGVSNTSTLYKRGIRVCTGTGIGAALSTCLQSKDWFLIWIGSDQEKTFGPTIAGLVNKLEPERRILWDSRKEGKRPDTMQLIRDTYKSWGAEVVFITSNFQGNQEMMEGCRSEGINAFGTLWDF